ncbi:hypothetical protein Cgig2_021380 [Carnegiea gigantea]|uniref:Protein FAR1-RELATED SEQUENCE n=1 Tax=Carnegiea gigantea TaxID=171969 RepID=A0A9Q1QGU3_9CARY|nr:hypothetical protein Cgig2_021380 [Carnegiea gigantea]
MPMNRHSFCIWHITSKFSGWFMAILHDQYPQWCADFYVLYKLDMPEEFECQWPQVVGKYNLRNNKHVIGLYQIKHFMRFVFSSTSLRDLPKQVELAVQEIRQTQLHNNMLAKSTITPLVFGSPLEKQGSQVLTPFAFQKLQEQIVRSSEYSILHLNGNNFVLGNYGATSTTRSHKVFWDGRIAIQYSLPPKSITKGRPRKRSMKGRKESSCQTKTCSICGRTRHNATTCLEIKENA